MWRRPLGKGPEMQIKMLVSGIKYKHMGKMFQGYLLSACAERVRHTFLRTTILEGFILLILWKKPIKMGNVKSYFKVL